MLEINGKSVYNASAMGRLYFYNQRDLTVKRQRIADAKAEILRFEDARARAKAELGEVYQKALEQVGETNARVFEIHMMMLDDEDYYGAIRTMILNQSVNAEFAVSYTSELFAKTFSDMNDEYMQARAADVADIGNRLLNILTGETYADQGPSQPSIVVARDLTPGETVQMDSTKVLGFVTFEGSPTSHTAILARTMNIPAVIGTGEIDPCHHGEMAILDGFDGALYINPDEEHIQNFKKRKELEENRAKLLSELKGKSDVTKSGQKINVYANIGNPSDLASVIQNDANGIGLFRSEFLYLAQNSLPTEDDQFFKYRQVVERMSPKLVIVRTMDIGADKNADYLNLPKEENPALGCRAVRLCLNDTGIFKPQLRALLRASVYGNLAVMVPMITSVWEVLKVKELIEEAKAELEEEGIPYNPRMEMGIMIETPAAAIISDQLAPHVDFFSIGTNDLTQYTLAIDRQNPNLDRYFDPHHQSVLRLIKTVADNAHKCGKWVGICGELAADLTLTGTFAEMGIDELSVSPPCVLPLREKIRSLD